MIWTMIWTGWTSLKRDKVALLLTFVLPIAFFSIFVLIFGGMFAGDDGDGGMSRVTVALVDEDQSESSRRFVEALAKDQSLNVRTTMKETPDALLDRAAAEAMVKSGGADVAAIIPNGFGATFPSFGPSAEILAVELIADEQRNPVAPQMVSGLMQKAAMMGAPDLMIERGLEQFDKYAGGLTPQQRAKMDEWLPKLRDQVEGSDATSGNEGGATEAGGDEGVAGFSGMVQVKVTNVQREHESRWSAYIAYQVAQTAVMFLLFSMAGAAGMLLEEHEGGTLERLLSSRLGMGGLLTGKWLFIALMGVAQLAVMFLWAWKPFGLDLWTVEHVIGFLIMATVTAAAGAAFGMMLATACRTRAQLGGVSTIVILMMSALGGSMIPRYIMPDALKDIGLITFNAWALDGFQKVFYDNLPVVEIWPQVVVLAGLAAAFMLIARLLARRWETA